MVVSGLNGRRYQLEQKPLGSGGEGDIFAISGNSSQVIKIYKKSSATQILEEKLKLMVQRPPSSSVLNQVAWPLDVVFDSAGLFCGFVMPKLNITHELNEVYVYPPKTGITYKQKLILAQNICVVIHEVHKAGYIFGDFNPRNIGVNLSTGAVAFLDTDSYHIVLDKGKDKAYRCNVCAPGYAAPELLNKCSAYVSSHPEYKKEAYAKTPLDTFTEETDNFALAIHMFRLLMNGYSPFNGIPEGESVSVGSPGQGDDAVKRDNYCFKKGKKPQAVAVPELETLPRSICDLFTRAFIEGKKNPAKRPSAIEWHKALDEFEKNLETCSNNPTHMYLRGLNVCPWCEADKRYFDMMSPQMVQKSFSGPAVTPPTSMNISTGVVGRAGMGAAITSNVYGGAQSWKKGKAKAKGNGFDLFGMLGWLAFTASVIAVCAPLVEGGSIHLDETNIYNIDVVKSSLIAEMGVLILSLMNAFSRKSKGDLAKYISGIWGFVFSISAATVRYTQLGYSKASAGEAWKTFGILMFLFVVSIIGPQKVNKYIVNRTGGAFKNLSNRKHQFEFNEMLFMIFMVAASIACTPLLWNLETYYFYARSYNLVAIAIWLIPIVVFGVGYNTSIIQKGESVNAWFGASMTTYFTCLVLWWGKVGSAGALFGWIILAIVALLFIVYAMSEIHGFMGGLIFAFFFVFFIAGAYADLQVMGGSPASVGEATHWFVVAPAFITIIIAGCTTIREVLGI